jgi:hypothetical protein
MATECHDGKLELFINSLVLWKGKSMNAIVTIGIDLAKNVFAVHGVDATGKPYLVLPSAHRAKLSRAQMSEAALSAMSGPWSKGKAAVQRPSYRQATAAAKQQSDVDCPCRPTS